MFGSQPQGFNLGNAHGKVIISSNVAEAMRDAQREVENSVQRIGSSLQNLGSSITSAGGQMTAITAPLAIFGATGLKAASDFDSAMTQISARTGLTGDALDEVRQQAMKMGADTVFSSQQAADAFLQLLTAGLDVDQAMSTLPNVLNAAAASGEDLGMTADLVTNIMSSFKLEAEETERIVEALSRAAASSPASMADLGFALQDAGGIASSFGLSVEDTAGLFAIFAKQGIRGSEAATQLRSMLVAMTSQTDKTQDVWKELGTSMFDAQGNMRNMDSILNDIRVGLDGMADENRNRIIKQLAGSYGLVGFEALLASDGIDAMKATMDGQTSATEVAAARMDTWEGTVNSLMGSIQTLQIEALTPFMNETLKPMAKDLIDVVNNITKWVQENPELAQTLVKLGAAAVVLGPALIILGTVISSVGTIVKAFGTALALVTSPAFLLAGAIGAILVATELGYPGGIVQLFRDATTTAQQLAFLGLYVLNLAAQNARMVIEGFIDVVIALKDRIVELTIENGGLILGFTGFAIAVRTTGVATMIFNKIMLAAKTLYIAVTGALGGASAAATGLGASMMAAVGPILAVGAAIAGVIYQMGQFSDTVNHAQNQARETLNDELASGAFSRKELEDAAFSATAGQFGGGIFGDIIARATYSNTANAIQGDYELRDSGGPGLAGNPYLIGTGAQPEVFVPSTNGTFIPNFDQVLAGAGGGMQIHGDIVVNANSYEEGRAAGRGVMDELMERWKGRGN